MWLFFSTAAALSLPLPHDTCLCESGQAAAADGAEALKARPRSSLAGWQAGDVERAACGSLESPAKSLDMRHLHRGGGQVDA